MGELILQTEIKREKEYLYYVKSDDEGNLGVYKAKMARGGKRKIIKKEKSKGVIGFVKNIIGDGE